MSPRALASLLAAAIVAAAGAFAPSAAAEEVVFASGARYQATDVQILDGGQVRVTYRIAGGSATLTVPWDRLDPWSALAIRSARVDPKDAKGQAALGRFALERGLFVEATRRFRKAADLDPALAAERDAGLADVRDAQLSATLDGALADLRRGRGDLALSTAKDVLRGAAAGTGVQQRAQSLVDLASSVAERDRARKDAEEKAHAAAVAAAEKAAFESGLARADKALADARTQRGRAADANVSASEATDALERAEALFREGRRLLAAMLPGAGARRSEVEARERDALSFLIATHLDLADLYRQVRRFDRARDRIRAVLVLDPDNVRAREIRDLVEADLHAPPPIPYDDPYPPPIVVIPSILSPTIVTPRVPPCDPFSSLGFGYRSRHWNFFFRW